MTLWLTHHWLLLLPLLLATVALWGLMPRPGQGNRIFAALVGLAALASAGALWLRPSGLVVQDVLFYLFAAVAVTSAVLMITNRNPVYAALWFALVTLSTCGLFLLQSAAFLAAATVIVYAGAIIVTFLFVIMLARQAGSALYDHRSNQPYLATLAAFVLLGGMLITLQQWGDARTTGRATAAADETPPATSPGRFVSVPEGVETGVLSRPDDGQYGKLRGLGRSLFGDYLFAVELAGTLLLVATIGAIAIAPRRSRGTL